MTLWPARPREQPGQPDGVEIEQAKSELEDGLLTLVIQKRASAQIKKIPTR